MDHNFLNTPTIRYRSREGTAIDVMEHIVSDNIAHGSSFASPRDIVRGMTDASSYNRQYWLESDFATNAVVILIHDGSLVYHRKHPVVQKISDLLREDILHGALTTHGLLTPDEPACVLQPDDVKYLSHNPESYPEERKRVWNYLCEEDTSLQRVHAARMKEYFSNWQDPPHIHIPVHPGLYLVKLTNEDRQQHPNKPLISYAHLDEHQLFVTVKVTDRYGE